MMKLTPEQRDEFAEWMRWEIFDGDNYLPAKVLKGLDRITAEDEVHEYEEYEDWRQYYCPCEGCEKERNQIALRKIEEYMSSHCVTAESLHLVRFQDWLQQEDEDG